MTEPSGATFLGSRRKSAFGAAGCAGAVALGGWFTTWSDTVRHSAEFYDVLGWLLMVLFGLFGLAWLVSLIVPHRLWVEREGFSVEKAWSGKKHYKWEEIEEIFVYRQRGTGVVAWKNKNSKGGVTRTIFGCDSWLPGGWELSPEEIAGELNYLRERNGT